MNFCITVQPTNYLRVKAAAAVMKFLSGSAFAAAQLKMVHHDIY